MNKYLKMGLLGLAGASAGYIYYHFWGCTSGCPLQSHWYVITGYGAVAGIVLGIPSRQKKKTEEIEQNDN
jgi:hypothetical protein